LIFTAQVIESILTFTVVLGKVMASPSAGLNKFHQAPDGARGLKKSSLDWILDFWRISGLSF